VRSRLKRSAIRSEISQGNPIELTEEMKKEALKVLAKVEREEFVHLLNLYE